MSPSVKIHGKMPAEFRGKVDHNHRIDFMQLSGSGATQIICKGEKKKKNLLCLELTIHITSALRAGDTLARLEWFLLV